MSTISIFLVEDSALIRTNLLAALEDLAPAKVIGFAESADEACRSLRELSKSGGCDLVIVDISLKFGSGLDVLRWVAASELPFQTVLLTSYSTPTIRAECWDLYGAHVFDRSREVDELINYCHELANA